jgi:hypothetical protein
MVEWPTREAFGHNDDDEGGCNQSHGNIDAFLVIA